ncbi:YhdT family protein [Aquibacillus koreensis]|uniref:YhdT family protein n=1 Tax=Aquibacillus koreensis TaxID=279446 RepID=A0A9X3WIX1_9BACI|nr:YhdT family protein [Aquibacillus koreensis]MCT2536542.1 YhdT family protein [Aquibacillus koreensis]MDC3419370.1 YhdT family protein [Aquibacillus koreensis]
MKDRYTDFKEDPRFKIANREALIGCGVAVINFIWWFGFAYGLGSKPVDTYTYIFGLPAWFFYSCIVGTVVIIGVVILMVKKGFKDIPLNHEGGDDL